MDDLLAARSQMAMSLAFHIVFACVGMAMPLLMVIAERRWQKTRDPVYLDLSKRWAKGTAIMFAVGAVSGTVLSFELGLLWPGFMKHAGPIIGMPFSLEGLAFFMEAIFLGLFLYGRKRLSPRLHLGSGFIVLLSGVASGVFVVTANAWMNTPAGVEWGPGGPGVGAEVVSFDAVAAMLNPAAFTQTLHMTLAAFVSVGFAVAAIHAYRLRRTPESIFDQHAFRIALLVGGVAACLQPLSGDLSAKHLAEHQPLKLAAMEGHWETERCAPLKLGGWPDEETETTPYAIDIPCGLSFLAFFDVDAEVRGIKEWPKEDRPPIAIVHLAFQLMIAIGMLLMLTALLGLYQRIRKRDPASSRKYLLLVTLCGPLGFVATEAGWVVTEVGRQPWVVSGWIRTADAVTPMKGLATTFFVFTVLYLVLAVVVVGLLRRHVFRAPTAPAVVATEAGLPSVDAPLGDGAPQSVKPTDGDA